MAAGGFRPEIMVKADNAMNVGSCQVQFHRDQGHGVGRDVSEMVLNSVKDWNQGARFVLQRLYNVDDLDVLDWWF
jgi:hypothetical protein